MPLHFAVRNSDWEIVKLLVNEKNINSFHSQGQTLLYLAVKSGNIDLVRFLLKQGADIDAKDIGGILFVFMFLYFYLFYLNFIYFLFQFGKVYK